MKTFKASTNPLQAINMVAYKGQDPKRRMYHFGYENHFNMMPILEEGDPFLKEKIEFSKGVMQNLANTIKADPWVYQTQLGRRDFQRTILAIEEPKMLTDQRGYKEGAEFVLAHWGDGHSSPIHGHAAGYLHEEVLFGKMRVNTFRMIDHTTVRPVATKIVTNGTFASMYSKEPKNGPKRQVLIHNFTSIGASATLHYLPEHTRDGRDNKFEVQRFGDVYKLTAEDVTRIDSKQGMYSQIGDVILVRSQNVPEYGDHYIVITGHPIMKEHGLRPQDEAIYAPDGSALLDQFEMLHGLTLLKLNKKAAAAFHEFHGITIEGKNVT
ncbi:MAG TPA: hypothetical protein V6C65_39305, partial [Allocoleopsis sp.]